MGPREPPLENPDDPVTPPAPASPPNMHDPEPVVEPDDVPVPHPDDTPPANVGKTDDNLVEVAAGSVLRHASSYGLRPEKKMLA